MKQFKSQSGRSMVEMLGVLAIVGVLSIGGIAGYSYGMDKYRANETTNQIMLRAVDLMTQAGNNNETLSFASWNNEASQYDFGTPEYTNDGLIVFDVGTNEKMPKRICEMVYDNLSEFAVQIDVNAVRAESNDVCADENEMTFYFEGQFAYTCDPACPEGKYCENGICFKGDKPEGTSLSWGSCTTTADCNQEWSGTCAYCSNNKCIYDLNLNGKACTIKDGNVPGQCNLGQCYPKGCTTNDDCKESGTFCASTNSSRDVRFQSGETGSCVPVDFVRKDIGGQIYYISNSTISWWDAEYACAAIDPNLKLLNANDLAVVNDGVCTKTPLMVELQKMTGDYGFVVGNNASGTIYNVSYNCSIEEDIRNDGYFLAVCK